VSPQTFVMFGLAASALPSLFAVGLRASLQDATYLFRRPGELVRALLAMNVVMPLFALTLSTATLFGG
jgi:BASS family bile acid:Na+ symporter